MTADISFSLLTGNSIETRRVRAGGVIFREDEQADEFFIIKSGYVRIQIGNRMTADLTTDSNFGESFGPTCAEAKVATGGVRPMKPF